LTAGIATWATWGIARAILGILIDFCSRTDGSATGSRIDGSATVTRWILSIIQILQPYPFHGV